MVIRSLSSSQVATTHPPARARPSWTVAALLGALLLASACSDGGDDCKSNAEREQLDLKLGGLAVRLIAEPAGIEFRRGDLLLTRAMLADADDAHPNRGLWFATTAIAAEMKYGSFKVEPGAPTALRRVARLGALKATQTGASFTLLDSGGAELGTATVAALAEGGVAVDLEGPETSNHASLSLPCQADEHFVGLGGQSWDVDHRGQTVPLWVAEDGLGKKDNDTLTGDWSLIGRRHSTHTPIPLTLSSGGYALLVDTPAYSVFALCSEQADVVRLETFQSALRLRVFAGSEPLDTLRQTSGHVGRPRMPPRWTFAPWIDAMYGSENIRRVIEKLRNKGVAASIIWSEDWRGGTKHGEGYTLEEDWHLDTKLYPDAPKLVADLAAAGFLWQTYNNTFVSASSDIYDEALSKGYTIQKATAAGGKEPLLFDGVKFEKSSLVDLRNPAAVAWTRAIFRTSLEIGAVGWMADFAEWMPPEALLHDGSSGLDAHNRYPVEYQKMHQELLDDFAASGGRSDTAVFVRSAWLGSQPLVSVVWAGDQQTDFSPGDGYPSVIPMGIGLGITGFPFYAHDIGGYMSSFTEPTTEELWFRWVTLGALSPVMRTHHGRSAFSNWNWESDDKATAHMARWSTLHLQLYPYLTLLAADAVAAGAPMVRPLALRWPSFGPGWSSTDVWMLGDRLIVAPVVKQGATSRTLQLPKGRFYGLLDGAVVDSDGSAAVTLQVPVSEIGALVPAGTLLVLLPATIQTTEPSASAIDLSDVADDREIWLFRGDGLAGAAANLQAGADGSFVEVGGLSYSWAPGDVAAGATQATWNGAAVQAADGAFAVVGSGTLAFEGGGKLEVKGGKSDRKLLIRLR